jgi:hypothetical protein
VSSGWAASPAAIDSGESRSRHGLYTFPSTGGGFIQMTMISTFDFCIGRSGGSRSYLIDIIVMSQACHPDEQSSLCLTTEREPVA